MHMKCYYFLFISIQIGCGPSFVNTWISLAQECSYKVGWNLSSDSVGEDENAKRFQQRQQRRQLRQTTDTFLPEKLKIV